MAKIKATAFLLIFVFTLGFLPPVHSSPHNSDSNSCTPSSSVKCESGNQSNTNTNCSTSNDCSTVGSECLHGLCTCNGSTSSFEQPTRRFLEQIRERHWPSDRTKNTYDHFHDLPPQCVGLAGSPCINGFCTNHAFCAYSNWNKSQIQRRTDFDGLCYCEAGFIPQAGLCKGGYFNEDAPFYCTLSIECIPGLICSQRKCSCPYRDQILQGQHCLSPVNGPCVKDEDCVNLAGCKVDLENGRENGHCICKAGFIENEERGCDIVFGQSCNLTGSTGSPRCDSVAGLMCIDNKCACGGFEQFDAGLRRCDGLVGAICHLPPEEIDADCPKGHVNGNGNVNGKEDIKFCGRNMDCVPRFQGHCGRGQGVCVCPFGFIETKNYTCVKGGN